HVQCAARPGARAGRRRQGEERLERGAGHPASGACKKSRHADYHNLYAYSIRKGPNPDLSLVFKRYNEALRIDPEHRGAHEYLGEAYLMVGNVAKAKEHLAMLDKLCFLPCNEYTDLKKAIADYERKQVSR